ncbi:MAG: preprotein translocase subunit SecA [Elusimicrobia bacterium GWA2_69_24]|nr:MAG: preprotein translocase subunit SecA [Elusimicrobia bacterium GWA2_69_24]
MIESLVYKIIGTPSERLLKDLRPLLFDANAFEEKLKSLPEAEFPARTAALRAALADRLSALPEDAEEEERKAFRRKAVLEFLPEAYALVREASRRTTALRHFDVQLLGGMVLNNGGISEMRTGEGKTLVATAPIYLNALTGRGCHLVTVNDYLAKRDCEWMGPIYRFLGLTVGFVLHDMPNEERRAAYLCDVTYVTNNELGFDYLRDNMVIRAEDRVLRPLHFAIVDEVDSILVDEARTPLIISGPAEESTDRYVLIDRIIPHLKVRFITEDEEVKAKYSGEDLGKGYDAVVDEKNHNTTLTDQGINKCEHLLGLENLYDDLAGAWVHHINQSLRAHHLYKRDVDYVVKDSEVVIVDEFTGRLMPGRRWSEGLHQAVEAKEKLPPREENQTLATITFQNFFKMYEKIGGMTGTAMTEADEFFEIYKLNVVEVPTNRDNVRTDHSDVIFLNQKGKWNAIVKDIEENWRRSRPILVGTRSIEKSEMLAGLLREKGIPHQVLNAKYHEMEAQIIAQAGKKGMVTIATNMAGRGTDIVLGGLPLDAQNQGEVVAVGGLYVMGTERHDARRIDNQLRGRCGRQGDPGETRFYLALDDELMRLFGSDRLQSLMEKFGMTEDEPIESGLVSKQIEGAQRRVETHNFDIRKQLVDYDNVMNKQREVVYGLRNRILDGKDVSAHVLQMFEEDVEWALDQFAPKEAYPEAWDIPSLAAHLKRVYNVEFAPTPQEVSRFDRGTLQEEFKTRVRELYAKRAQEFEGYDFHEIEKMVLLQMIDHAWKNHLYDLDHMKRYIHLRAYGQKDPKIEYQKESFTLFEAMLERIRHQTVEYLFRIQAPKRAPKPVAMAARHDEPGAEGEEAGEGSSAAAQPRRSILKKGDGVGEGAPVLQKIGRNDPCPCGSGKKYKKCCGK